MLKPMEKLARAMGLDRRQVLFAGGSASIVAAMPSGIAAAFQCDRIVVGAWGGDFSKTIADTIGSSIKASHGAEFVADVGAASARKSRLMAERDRATGSTDVVCLDSMDMHQMASLGLLMEPPAAEVPNLANVYPEFARRYSVPQAFSAKVIVYNPDKMARPASFADLWNTKYAGKIGLADLTALAVIESAALIAGGSATNYEPGKAKLLELKATGVKLYPSNEALAVALQSGEVWATIMWRARAHQWKNSGVPVTHAVPEEGATPITFEVGAPRNAPNKGCAAAFLNRVLDPEAQVTFAQRMGYVPTVHNAKLPTELASEIDFSPAQRASFFKQDLTYITQNQPQLLDWWSKVFKA